MGPVLCQHTEILGPILPRYCKPTVIGLQLFSLKRSIYLALDDQYVAVVYFQHEIWAPGRHRVLRCRNRLPEPLGLLLRKEETSE